MKKNKQKRTMKQKVSQKVIVNIKNALPKTRRAQTRAKALKHLGLSSQYTNPYLIGAFKQAVPPTAPDSGIKSEIVEIKKALEKKKEEKKQVPVAVPLALPAPEAPKQQEIIPVAQPMFSQEDMMAKFLDAMKQQKEEASKQKQTLEVEDITEQVKAMKKSISQGQQALLAQQAFVQQLALKNVAEYQPPPIQQKRQYNKKDKPIEKVQSSVASLIQEQAKEQAQAIQEQAPVQPPAPAEEEVVVPPPPPIQQVHLVLPKKKMTKQEAAANARAANAAKRAAKKAT